MFQNQLKRKNISLYRKKGQLQSKGLLQKSRLTTANFQYHLDCQTCAIVNQTKMLQNFTISKQRFKVWLNHATWSSHLSEEYCLVISGMVLNILNDKTNQERKLYIQPKLSPAASIYGREKESKGDSHSRKYVNSCCMRLPTSLLMSHKRGFHLYLFPFNFPFIYIPIQ